MITTITAKSNTPLQSNEACPSFKRKLGNTTYTVKVHFSKDSY
ncbi:hypothetical protein D7V82_18205 [bacterium 1xD8-6]|nr:hypothetical protein D7V72_19340 [bacterium D16-36]RKI64543.1 hypothetical protein D7V82_18205 [bacterium 1xD8-6]